MTFLQEEEVFPTLNNADGIKEEANGTSGMVDAEDSAKRKKPEKSADKKVFLFLYFFN